MSDPVLETARLRLRLLGPGDAAFILELVNDAAWLRFIGDKGVATREDAARYIAEGPAASYAAHGFGLWAVERKAGGGPLGICGLIRRAELADVDLGFAFLERHRGRGYAREAATACLEHGRSAHGLERIVAITLPDNAASIGVLRSAGMSWERRVRLGGRAEELELYAWTAPL